MKEQKHYKFNEGNPEPTGLQLKWRWQLIKTAFSRQPRLIYVDVALDDYRRMIRERVDEIIREKGSL